MAKYRKKSIIVDAEIYHKGLEDGIDPCGYCPTTKWEAGDDDCSECFRGKPYINTPEGKLYISKGDYIISGLYGKRYLCKSDVFEQAYELAE